MNKNKEKTHCLRGHAFTEKNTWIDKKGRRICRPCRSARTIAWRNKNYDKVIARERLRESGVLRVRPVVPALNSDDYCLNKPVIERL